MEYFYLIFPCFNILVGTMMAMVGFKLYKPLTDESMQRHYEKFSIFYKIGGIVVLLYGTMTLLLELKAI
jgi:hypothetical protein